jgi:uncharacterized protein
LITYVDSSVALRIVLGAPEPLVGWEEIEHAVSSALLYVECQRTLERMRLAENKPVELIAIRKKSVDDLISAVALFDVTNGILHRAANPFIVPLKTLDAIHLATALAIRDESQEDVAFATHDVQLARAASALDFPVLGIA